MKQDVLIAFWPAQNLRSSCLSLLSAGVLGMHHYIRFWCYYLNEFFTFFFFLPRRKRTLNIKFCPDRKKYILTFLLSDLQKLFDVWLCLTIVICYLKRVSVVQFLEKVGKKSMDFRINSAEKNTCLHRHGCVPKPTSLNSSSFSYLISKIESVQIFPSQPCVRLDNTKFLYRLQLLNAEASPQWVLNTLCSMLHRASY